MTKTNRAKLLFIIIIYGTVIGSTFSPDSRAIMVKAFGASPFGLSNAVVIAVAQALLLLPLVWVIHHAAPIMKQALRDQSGFGVVSLIGYLFQVGKLHPSLRRSQYVSLLGLVYFIAIVASWIIYADSLGI